MDHGEIIRSLGGYKAVADDLELNHTTVFKWLKNGIPARRWVSIVNLAERNRLPGVSLDSIAKARPEATIAA